MNDYIDLEDIEDIDQDNGEDVEKDNENFSRGSKNLSLLIILNIYLINPLETRDRKTVLNNKRI